MDSSSSGSQSPSQLTFFSSRRRTYTLDAGTKTRRTEWQRLRLELLRLELIRKLGGKCAHCGTKDNLEINHIYKRDWSPKKTNQAKRLRIYIREADEGKINLLCADCNKKYKPLKDEIEPF